MYETLPTSPRGHSGHKAPLAAFVKHARRSGRIFEGKRRHVVVVVPVDHF